jgi:fibronectin-binding autotransporter adhesin
MFLNLWRRMMNQYCQASRRPARPSRALGIRLRLELLEDRTMPATITWLNPVDGNWGEPAKWDLNRVPMVGDDVVIAYSGIRVEHTGADMVQSVSVSSGTLVLEGDLNVSGTLSGSGTFQFYQGTLRNATVASGTTITGTNGGGTLDNVTLNGTLDLATVTSVVAVSNGLMLDGTVNVGNSGGTTAGSMVFINTQTIGGSGSIVLGGSLSIVTLDSTLMVHGKNGVFDVVPGAGTFLNKTTIAADTAGQIALYGTWQNSNGGFKADTGATLEIHATVTNLDTLTLSGAGQVKLFGGTIIGGTINGGTLTGTPSGGTLNGVTFYGDLDLTTGNSSLTNTGDYSNAGYVTIGSGSTFTVGGNYTQTGGTTTLNGGTLTVAGNYVQTDGTTKLNGGTLAGGNPGTLVDIQGGILTGKGLISADVQNAAQMIIGDDTLMVGILTINGNFTQTAAGTLAAKVGGFTTAGVDFDRLALTAGHSATLDGTLQVTLINGYAPTTGDSIQIMTFASETGTFAALTGDGSLFTDTYEPGDVKLVAN